MFVCFCFQALAILESIAVAHAGVADSDISLVDCQTFIHHLRYGVSKSLCRGQLIGEAILVNSTLGMVRSQMLSFDNSSQKVSLGCETCHRGAYVSNLKVFSLVDIAHSLYIKNI